MTVIETLMNLASVRTGAVCACSAATKPLLRRRLIRVNNCGWYDLTPAGRRILADPRDEIAAMLDDESVPAAVQHAYELGAGAFARGAMGVPAWDCDLMEIVARSTQM
ncbi:MAG: hypothetical protein ACR2M1_16990 [Gemmatimonadaceae bacterium]